MSSSAAVLAPTRGPADTKRWQLTTESFEALLARLTSDGGPVPNPYERLHRRLTSFFDRRGCFDADTWADVTLDRVARQLDEGKAIENVCRYAYGIARFINLESIRQRARRQAALAEVRPHQRTENAPDPRLACLETQLERMRPELRCLLIEYYGAAGRAGRERLAERFGLTYGALKARVHRLRTQLEHRLLAE